MPTPIEETLPQQETGAAPAEWVSETLEELEEMNADSAEGVAESGVTPVRIEFAFAAGTQEAADRLVEYFETEADYEVEVRAPQTETDEWAVSGTTGEVAVTPAGIDKWVRTMVVAGWVHGQCRLDGWSALFG